MAVGALAPGAQPSAVLPAAAAAAAELVVVEASDVQVVSGQPRIVVRFTADDAEIADQVARHVASTTAAMAQVLSWQLTERAGSRWAAV